MYYSDGSYIYAALKAEDAPKLWGIFFKPLEDGCFTRLGPDFTELPDLWRVYKTEDSAEIALLALAEGYGLIPVDERGKVLCMAPQEAYARRYRGVKELVFSDGRFCYALLKRPEEAGGGWNAGFKLRGAVADLTRFREELKPDRRLLKKWREKERAEACLRAVACDYGLILVDDAGRPLGGPWRDGAYLPYRSKARGIIRRAEARCLMRELALAEALAMANAEVGAASGAEAKEEGGPRA